MAIESTPHPLSKPKTRWFPHCFESINGADGIAGLRSHAVATRNATTHVRHGCTIHHRSVHPDLTMPDLVNDSQHDAPANDHVRSG